MMAESLPLVATGAPGMGMDGLLYRPSSRSGSHSSQGSQDSNGSNHGELIGNRSSHPHLPASARYAETNNDSVVPRQHEANEEPEYDAPESADAKLLSTTSTARGRKRKPRSTADTNVLEQQPLQKKRISDSSDSGKYDSNSNIHPSASVHSTINQKQSTAPWLNPPPLTSAHPSIAMPSYEDQVNGKKLGWPMDYDDSRRRSIQGLPMITPPPSHHGHTSLSAPMPIAAAPAPDIKPRNPDGEDEDNTKPKKYAMSYMLRRKMHNISERKRRNSIKEGFFELSEKVPGLCAARAQSKEPGFRSFAMGERGERYSKMDILRKAAAYIRSLTDENKILMGEVDELRKEMDALLERKGKSMN